MIESFVQLFQNNFDQKIFALFLAHRSSEVIIFFKIISFFGDWRFVTPAMLIIILFLFIKKRKEIIAPLLLEVIGAEIVTFLGKVLFHRSRPDFATYQAAGFSFPSGHATIAVALYGYLSYFLIKSLKGQYKWLIITASVSIAFLIGFSRLYLGVHYFSDVVAGYLVGLLALIIGIYLDKKTMRENKVYLYDFKSLQKMFKK